MNSYNKVSILEKILVLKSLTNDELTQLAELSHLRRAPRYHFIFMPDEPAEHIYILLKGRVKTGTFAPDGREVIKDILQPQTIFGDMALTGEEKRTDYAQSLHEEVEYLSLKVSDVKQFMHTNQSFMFSCFQHLSYRLQRVEERLTKLVVQDARKRIIGFLLESAHKEGRTVGYETLVRHQLTQQDIASITGTSRQTVTSVLNDLRKSNLIHFNRNTILIRDMAKLA
jgi:CRP-like cAMP-binding protein